MTDAIKMREVMETISSLNTVNEGVDINDFNDGDYVIIKDKKPYDGLFAVVLPDSMQDAKHLGLLSTQIPGTKFETILHPTQIIPSTREEYEKHNGNMNLGESEECEHEWVEGVDDDGNLVEPAYDVCVNCGAVNEGLDEWVDMKQFPEGVKAHLDFNQMELSSQEEYDEYQTDKATMVEGSDEFNIPDWANRDENSDTAPVAEFQREGRFADFPSRAFVWKEGKYYNVVQDETEESFNSIGELKSWLDNNSFTRHVGTTEVNL